MPSTSMCFVCLAISRTVSFCLTSFVGNGYIWEFPNLVVSNLVVCNFDAEALFCSLLHPLCSFCALLRSFAPFCGFDLVLLCGHFRSFGVSLRPPVFRAAFGSDANRDPTVSRN